MNFCQLVYVYYLIDPETGRVRYVGKTKEPNIRIILHQRVIMPNHPKWEWILSLKAKGMKPIMKVVEACHRPFGKSREEHHILQFCSDGLLLNQVLPHPFKKNTRKKP